MSQSVDLLTEKIIGCAFKVHNVLGSGFLESVYENALLFELRKAGLPCQSQAPLTVRYEGEVVGNFIADVIVDDRIILELKSIQTLLAAHAVQLVNYLVATGIDDGLLINFGSKSVEIRRKFRKLQKPVDRHGIL